jgi:hypothetical protein
MVEFEGGQLHGYQSAAAAAASGNQGEVRVDILSTRRHVAGCHGGFIVAGARQN